MSQSKTQSAIESVANTAAGFLISVAITYTVLPVFGHVVTTGDAIGITMVFTAASLARSYVVRRVFNRQVMKEGQE